MAERNFLLGYGEKLTENAAVASSFGQGNKPYSFAEATRHLGGQAKAASSTINALPPEACPDNQAVAVLTLHPRYVSKSAYPADLLDSVGLRAVGSKSVTITPRKTGTKSAPKPTPTTSLYIAGDRKQFGELANQLPLMRDGTDVAAEIMQIEDLHAPTPIERVRSLPPDKDTPLLEVVLHAGERRTSFYILDGFRAYLATLDIAIDLDQRIDAGGLTFIPVRVPRDRVADVARFAFLRTAREMPRLRQFRPMLIPRAGANPFAVSLPTGQVVDPTIRAAIFDGGVPDLAGMTNWVRRIDGDGVDAKVDEYERHGLAVTSAALFGPLKAGVNPSVPYARVDHYRVLDVKTDDDPQMQLYPVIKRIVAVLERETYDFVNLSIGPAIPLDDDDVHPWTAKLDPLLANGKTFASVAVGNSGEADRAARLDRIQPPSDCVNAFSVGACDDAVPSARAPYSSVGHGRCPGIVKPDGVAFGGTATSPFWTIGADCATLFPTMGTSFASPHAMRAAMGVRARLGPVIAPLGLRALLVHKCADEGQPIMEVGWGRICTDVEELVTCASSECHVIYQGELDPRKYLRARIPIPADRLTGKVTITATICIACDTDPDHPVTYTRSGLDVYFRKDRMTVPDGKSNPATSKLFKRHPFMSEMALRNDAYKWETTRRATVTVLGSTLIDPCVDIHYNPRFEGRDAARPKPVPYAMVISISAPKVADLYDRVLERYRFQLAPLKPRLELRL